MRMLRSWPIKIPNMNKMQQKTNDQLRTQDVRTDTWSNKHEKGYNSQQKTNDQLRKQGLGTDGRTRVFQYTHHSASGGIINGFAVRLDCKKKIIKSNNRN